MGRDFVTLYYGSKQAISPGVVATEIVPRAKNFENPKAAIAEVYGKIDFEVSVLCMLACTGDLF